MLVFLPMVLQFQGIKDNFFNLKNMYAEPFH